MKFIKHRSSGYINSRYYDEKEKLRMSSKKGFCWICGKKLKGKRKQYCSDECFKKWFKQFNPPFFWNDIKTEIFKRDNYTCKKCGRTEKQLEEWYKTSIKYHNKKIICDHIIPIALGGDERDLNNLQTLCVDCNMIKTSEDIKKIAELRREIKGIKKNANTTQTKISIHM